MKLRGAICLFALVLLTCAIVPSARVHAQEFVTLLAAASTSPALEKIIISYNDSSAARVRAAYASSAALARQIEAGAPADIFLSANLKWIDYLEGEQLLHVGSLRRLLHNRLALVAPKIQPFELTLERGAALGAVLGNGRLAMGDPTHVPAGQYAEAALRNLGIWQQVESRLALAANVRAALAFVERGEAAAGLVYATDAASSSKVHLVDFVPESAHPPIIYALVVVAGRASEAVCAFVAHLLSPEAGSVFESYGFAVLEQDEPVPC